MSHEARYVAHFAPTMEQRAAEEAKVVEAVLRDNGLGIDVVVAPGDENGGDENTDPRATPERQRRATAAGAPGADRVAAGDALTRQVLLAARAQAVAAELASRSAYETPRKGAAAAAGSARRGGAGAGASGTRRHRAPLAASVVTLSAATPLTGERATLRGQSLGTEDGRGSLPDEARTRAQRESIIANDDAADFAILLRPAAAIDETRRKALLAGAGGGAGPGGDEGDISERVLAAELEVVLGALGRAQLVARRERRVGVPTQWLVKVRAEEDVLKRVAEETGLRMKLAGAHAHVPFKCAPPQPPIGICIPHPPPSPPPPLPPAVMAMARVTAAARRRCLAQMFARGPGASQFRSSERQALTNRILRCAARRRARAGAVRWTHRRRRAQPRADRRRPRAAAASASGASTQSASWRSTRCT